jgi:hypothetical protein
MHQIAFSKELPSAALAGHCYYANTDGNPVNYTDPSGNCILSGVDTLACLVALAIGIPLVAGITGGAWNYSVTQGGGVGGYNQFSQNCIDWTQVVSAATGATLGAFETTTISVPLGPVYLYSAIAYDMTPTEVNESILANFGLDDEYRNALDNPNYYYGQVAGSTSMLYISLASFVQGLPQVINYGGTLSDPEGLFFIDTGGRVLIGGNGILVYSGVSGTIISSLYLSKGGYQLHHPLPKYLLGPEKQELYGLTDEQHMIYHKELDQHLPRNLGSEFYMENFSTPEEQAELYEWLRSFNKYFDRTYGTHTYEALEDVLRAEGWLK